MSRTIFPLQVFERRLVKFIKTHPELKSEIPKILLMLSKDIRTPSLSTHKLHGKMKDSYGCNINYRYRIIFSFDDDYVYLESIGSHDDVY